MKILPLIIVCFALTVKCYSQEDRFVRMAHNLEAILIDHPGLDETVETTVSNVSLVEFLRSLGINHRLNLNVQNDLNDKLINNFADARVADVLLFLCKEYDLDLELIGGIISVKKYIPPLPEPPEYIRRLPDVEYNEQNGFLSLDLKRDSLDVVARQITQISMRNVVLAPELAGEKVSAYIQNRPFEDALEKMCFANGLTVTQDGNFFLIEKNFSSAQDNARQIRKSQQGQLHVEFVDERLSVFSEHADIARILAEVSRESAKNYFLYTVPEGQMSLFVENATYEEFLTYLFHGTEYSFTLDENVYLIGSSTEDGLVTTELIPLQHRTIENVFGSLGSKSTDDRDSGSRGRQGGSFDEIRTQFFSEDLDIQPFPELNAFIVRGSYPQVQSFKDFITQIDQVVPVVTIEVLIVDVSKNKTLSAGITAGLGENNQQTGGSIIGAEDGGLNMDLSTASINSLLTAFNGLGVVNLGNVTPDFYLSIQALEADGLLRTRSTPKLSTLNSYTSTLSIGRQEYYLETTTNVNASAANNVLTEQQRWESIDADLTIEITPVVSSAEQVTLDISVTQSNFTERAGATGPFGTVNREFESSIRVKNGEMILLGGLEDKSVSNSGSGLPLLSRIPILRWFFGQRTRSTDQTKLNIFIRPSIMY